MLPVLGETEARSLPSAKTCYHIIAASTRTYFAPLLPLLNLIRVHLADTGINVAVKKNENQFPGVI